MNVLISFQRLNSKNFLVRYETKNWWSRKTKLLKEEIMCEEDLEEFLQENKIILEEVQLQNGINFERMLAEYRKHKKKGISLAGQRVEIENVKVDVSKDPFGVSAKIKFDVIGGNHESLVKNKQIKMYPLMEEATAEGVEKLFGRIFQLYYSGYHATEADEQKLQELFEIINQPHKKGKEEIK